MPIYGYKCPGCGAETRRLMSAKEALAAVLVCSCGVEFQRHVKAPSSQTMEVIDNGARVRRLERLSDAQDIYREYVKQEKS